MTMQTTTRSRFLLSTLGCLLLAASASAQQMPQDNWRYDGLQFSSPVPTNQLRSIAIGSGGVYVGEVFSGGVPNRVLRFTEAGVFVSRFADTFGYILGIACDSAGNVYVLDRTSSSVKKYDSAGNALTSWGSAGSGDGQFSLATATGNTMIAVSGKTGEIFVCDPGNTRVQVFNNSGIFLRKWGQAGSLPGQFSTGLPSAIAVSDAGNVFLSGSNGSAVSSPAFKVFDLDGLYLRGSGGHPGHVTSIALSKDGALAARFYSIYSGDRGLLLYDPNSTSFDTSYNLTSNIPISSDSGAAFSVKGHIYGLGDTFGRLSYREYSEAINFTNPTGIPHPLVLSSSQRAGTNLVDVDYQVTDSDSATVSTALLAVRDGQDEVTIGNAVGMRTFVEGTSGNVGANQPTGSTRHVTWNMPADWAVDYANIRVEAMAKDSRNLMGVHWITVPASGGQPAFQISSKPVTDAMLRDLWLWFMGNGMVNTAYSYVGQYGWWGTITGNSGIYTGFKFCEDYGQSGQEFNRSTPAGRLYAFEQMGARPITGAEKARAQAGKFGITSVSDNSIVKLAGVPTSYLKGFGSNSYGQTNWLSLAAPNLSKISAGGDSSFYITADGTLWGMGDNTSGKLGDGTTATRFGPVIIATSVAQVSPGTDHTLFVKTDGTLWAVGANNAGQLGDGTTTNRSTLVQVATGVVQCAVSRLHSLFIKTDGTLWAVGYNNYGQLGDGTTANRTTPVQVATSVSQCAAGWNQSLFVKTDGTLWAMGYNIRGQLGDGTTTNRLTPVQIATGVAQAATGGSDSSALGTESYHSVYLKTNGTLWAMGSNNAGQLGDGTTTQRITPVQVATGVSQVAIGYHHTVFRKTDNTVWAMGYNASGQLGDGLTTHRTTPYQFDTNAAGIAAGGNHTLTFTIP